MNTFLWKQFESNGEKRRIWRRTRNLSPSACYRESLHYEDSDKGTVFGEFSTDRPGIEIFYYPEERDDKGELIKAGHYLLLRRAALLSQPENEKVILWVTMLLFTQKQMIQCDK